MTIQVIVKTALLAGFCTGVGFFAAQEAWWLATGLAGLCHG